MTRNKIFNWTVLVLLTLTLSTQHAFADHLKGGWIKYSYLGQSGANYNYSISFYQYSDCSEPEKVDQAIFLNVFDAQSLKPVTEINLIALTSLKTEEKSNFGPCFQNPPTVCYLVAEYTTTISLPSNASGYVLSVQRCCRINGIENVPISNTIGLTYTVTIPGGSNYYNSSPVFDFNDTAAICYNSPFKFDFSARDDDNDSLVYSLCDGISGGSQFTPIVENPAPPPYNSIPYISPYTGKQPLGANATINPATGILSGIAPAEVGTYVVAVCIDEYRKGVYISHTRKELHLQVSDCRLGVAQLDPSYITCDGFNFTFTNKAGNNPDYSYLWDFGVTGLTTDTSHQPDPTYIYPDTGVYTVKLKANNNLGCEDSAEADVKIYPGFITDFAIDGSCIKNPYNFTDLTQTKYGVVDSWKWFFGEDGLLDDTTKNPVYTYPSLGQKTISLVTTNSKGCIDTATHALEVDNGPNLTLNFKDTLICSIDTLQLRASSVNAGAIFSWSPSYNILNENSTSPLVYPKQTTSYNVNVSYKGCTTTDSVLVNVIDKVDLMMPKDTGVCQGDSIQLVPVTNALYFNWSPVNGLNNAALASPVTAPSVTTTYNLIASVGKCLAHGSTLVKVAPYPLVAVSNDVTICYGRTTQLNATIKGSSFAWSPSSTLENPNKLTPVAGPQSTTSYVLAVTDTIGCPKPVFDTIVVSVMPPVQAFAGNDTAVIRSQPLQLNAKGGTNYLWSPSGNLSNPFIANPVVTFTDGPDTVSYNVKVSTPEGCYANDSIKVYIFETNPEVFVPSAFTPNGDGVNDKFDITVAGMKTFMYMRIYNRWGQLLYNTGNPEIGWNGIFNGKPQASGTYVYVIQAVDYNNKAYFKKGTFVLIR